MSADLIDGKAFAAALHGAHAEPDAQGRQPIARSRPVAEATRQLRHQADPRGGEGVAAGDRAAVRVDPGVVVGEHDLAQPVGGDGRDAYLHLGAHGLVGGGVDPFVIVGVGIILRQ